VLGREFFPEDQGDNERRGLLWRAERAAKIVNAQIRFGARVLYDEAVTRYPSGIIPDGKGRARAGEGTPKGPLVVRSLVVGGGLRADRYILIYDPGEKDNKQTALWVHYDLTGTVNMHAVVDGVWAEGNGFGYCPLVKGGGIARGATISMVPERRLMTAAMVLPTQFQIQSSSGLSALPAVVALDLPGIEARRAVFSHDGEGVDSDSNRLGVSTDLRMWERVGRYLSDPSLLDNIVLNLTTSVFTGSDFGKYFASLANLALFASVVNDRIVHYSGDQ